MLTFATLVMATQTLAVDLVASVGAGPSSTTTVIGQTVTTENKTAYLVNLGGNFINLGAVALGWELPFGFGGSSRIFVSGTPTTRSVYTESTDLLFTPGVRLRIIPASPITPWVSGGVGAARTAQAIVSGTGTATANTIWHPAVSAAGGIDIKFLRYFLIRGEVRNYYLSSFGIGNTALRAESRNNLLFMAGIGVRF